MTYRDEKRRARRYEWDSEKDFWGSGARQYGSGDLPSYQGRSGRGVGDWQGDLEARERQLHTGERSVDYGRETVDESDYVYEEDLHIPGPFYGVGPRGYQRHDDHINEEICERLTRHGQVDARDVRVEVSGGEVTLRGSVSDRSTARLIEDAVEGVLGVKEIHNELRLHQHWNQSRRGRSDDMRRQLHEGMSVVGEEGREIGVVQELRDHFFTVHRPQGDRFNLDYEYLKSVDDRVHLRVPVEELERHGWQMPQRIDDGKGKYELG